MNIRKSLVVCFSSSNFTRIRALFERSQWARDPEWVIANAIDLSRSLCYDFMVGLLVCSLLEAWEVDLLAVLARTADWSWRHDAPCWNYTRAARLRTAIPRSKRRSWKQHGDGEKLRAIRAKEKDYLRSFWARIATRLETGTQALAAVG